MPRFFVDHSHLGRTVTGLERITLELFSGDALAPLRLEPVRGGSTLKMMATQQLGLPARLLANPGSVVFCPGFPPSIPLSIVGGRRVIPYIHDCFLLTRPQELNWRARRYMAPAFRYAVRHLPWFLVNSESTRAELKVFARPDAEISLYRPVVRDVFGIGDRSIPSRQVTRGGRLSLIALGTIEPRKNLTAAAAIVRHLREDHGYDATLDLVGRPGWGGEADRLKDLPGVVMHGYCDEDRVRELLAAAHVFLSTSHDEGLGLPLIEAQYAGLAVIAPEKAVFREVLGASGHFIDPADPSASAKAIAGWIAEPEFFSSAAVMARANVDRWNAAARADRDALVARLTPAGGS